MALEIKVEITNTKDKLIIADVTGNYNGVTNPGGWDATSVENPAYSDITALTLDVYYPGSSIADLSAFDLYTTSYFTSTDRAYDLTSNVTLQDGVWQFDYNYTVSGGVTNTIYSLRDIDLKCKIGQLALGDMETNNFDEIKSMYDRMVQAFLCEEYVFAQELYEEISDMLTDCSPYSVNCNC